MAEGAYDIRRCHETIVQQGPGRHSTLEERKTMERHIIGCRRPK